MRQVLKGADALATAPASRARSKLARGTRGWLARTPLAWRIGAFATLFVVGALLYAAWAPKALASWATPTPIAGALHLGLETIIILLWMLPALVTWHALREEESFNVIVLASGLLAAALLDFGHLLFLAGSTEGIGGPASLAARLLGRGARLAVASSLLLIAFRGWGPVSRPSQRRWLKAGAGLLVMGFAGLGAGFPWSLELLGPGARSEGWVEAATNWLVVAGTFVAWLQLWRRRPVLPALDGDGVFCATWLFLLGALCFALLPHPGGWLAWLGQLYELAAFFAIDRLLFDALVRQPAQRLAVETALKELAQRQVRNLAYFDSLTGLPNAFHLRESVARAFTPGSEGQPLALLVAGVDGLAQINDSYGHAFGDRVIRTIADRLSQGPKEHGAIFRLEGGRFAILVEGADASRRAGEIAERVLREIAVPMQVFGTEAEVTAHVGVAVSPEDGDGFDAMLTAANSALHSARGRCAGKPGGGWLRYETAMSALAIERFNLRKGLRRALERGELELHYQPQFDLQRGGLVGVEALMRWRAPGQGMVAPARFIPQAEESGLIVPLGAWALEEACRQAARWRAEGLRVPVVAVNMSATQFHLSRVEDTVRQALDRAQLPGEALELELTESILLNDTENVQATLRRLKAMGVRLSIDDFGTGYSGLAYLRVFPIDKLKIDQSFVRELGREADNEVIVSTIIQLARSLGMETIAEGVETAAAARILYRLGCGQAQGYRYARPMPANDLAVLLQRLQWEGVAPPEADDRDGRPAAQANRVGAIN